MFMGVCWFLDLCGCFFEFGFVLYFVGYFVVFMDLLWFSGVGIGGVNVCWVLLGSDEVGIVEFVVVIWCFGLENGEVCFYG